MTTSNHTRSMTEPELAVYRDLRGLENYNMQYINANFPVLSFVFALYSGGEHTLYCDFSADYLYAYLLQFLPGMNRELVRRGGPEFINKVPEYMRGVLQVLHDLYERSQHRTVPVTCTPEEWDTVLSAIKVEVLGPHNPMPVW